MSTQQIISKILNYQSKPQLLPGSILIPVTIILKNGNIVLKDFKILAVKGNTITGITKQEEYFAPREDREPVYSYFKLDEIKAVEWSGVELVYK